MCVHECYKRKETGTRVYSLSLCLGAMVFCVSYAIEKTQLNGKDENIHDCEQQQCGIRWFTAHLFHATIETLCIWMSGRSIVCLKEEKKKMQK